VNSTKIYGLIGKSLAHSFSRNYFTDKFDNQGIASSYMNYEINKCEEVVKLLKDHSIHGLNVTIPYKEEIIQYLDKLTSEAQVIGAVNTIQFKDGMAIGHNTDVYGFRQMIKPFFKSQHERGLILGTGGASKAVTHVLENLGCRVSYISRNVLGESIYSYKEINDHMLNAHKLIVNTTPVGMYPDVDDFPEIPFEHLTPSHLVVDLVYNPTKTVFLRKAEKMGAIILNGKTMLEQQAEKSWEIWNE
jgi:shikimate dehydrogenase